MVANSEIDLKVFYLWDTESQKKHDPGFKRDVRWDVPLLLGYESEFVPNTSRNPGTDRFFGIRNPELPKRLKSWKPDAALLIGYRYESFLRLIFTRQRRRGFPLIFRGDSHRLAMRKADMLTSDKLKSGFRTWGISQIYRRFAAVTYVGEANREYFRMHGVPEKLFFAPHAVDNERFMSNNDDTQKQAAHWRDELGIPQKDLLVLFAGKFEEKKRPLDLLDAFKRLDPHGTSLLFVGSGKLEEELRRLSQGLTNVFFASFQNQSQMPRTYAACDLFVLPSYGPEESWGLAINEALCLAKPVIVSSHVGCGPDLVRHGENGLIFEAGNIGSLTDALRTALSDRERLRQWGEKGRAIVQDYDYAHATKGLLQALSYILER